MSVGYKIFAGILCHCVKNCFADHCRYKQKVHNDLTMLKEHLVCIIKLHLINSANEALKKFGPTVCRLEVLCKILQ